MKTPGRPIQRSPTTGLFLAGTDTNVGKTVATAALGIALQRTGASVGVMKPVETGSVQDDTTSVSDSHRLRKLLTPHANMALLNPYCFPPPVAPAEAARLSHTRIKLTAILEAYRTLAGHHEYMLVEGVGGVLVPLTHTEDVRGLITLLDIPCLVVSRTSLGAINHTRLTLMGLRQVGIPVAGVLLNHTSEDASRDMQLQTGSTVAWIRRLSGVPVFGPLPFQADMDRHWEERINMLAGDATMQAVAAMVRESD